MKTKLDIAQNAGLQSLMPTNLPSVQQNVGVLGRAKANRAGSREASRVLTELTVARLQAEERVGTTQIAISEAAVKGAMVAEGMSTLGALTVDIALKTGAVQSKLTATASAERMTHIATRADTRVAISTRVAQGSLSEDEAVALNSYAESDLVSDIERTNERIKRSKEAVEVVHDLALGGLRRATDMIR
jgi:propanediol dehydratase large subunit